MAGTKLNKSTKMAFKKMCAVMLECIGGHMSGHLNKCFLISNPNKYKQICLKG